MCINVNAMVMHRYTSCRTVEEKRLAILDDKHLGMLSVDVLCG